MLEDKSTLSTNRLSITGTFKGNQLKKVCIVWSLTYQGMAFLLTPRHIFSQEELNWEELTHFVKQKIRETKEIDQRTTRHLKNTCCSIF